MVVGLGNPGREYADTPHNAGYRVVDELAQRQDGRLRRQSRFNARIGQVELGGQPVLLVEPETYMNNSGLAVAGLMAYRKIETADLVLVLDDADLELGRLRIRARGSSGGHRGLDSVIRCVGTADFARVRVGVGRGAGGGGLVGHVLGSFSRAEGERMKRVVRQAADAVSYVLESGVEAAMNRFNGVTVEPTEVKDSNVESES